MGSGDRVAIPGRPAVHIISNPQRAADAALRARNSQHTLLGRTRWRVAPRARVGVPVPVTRRDSISVRAPIDTSPSRRTVRTRSNGLQPEARRGAFFVIERGKPRPRYCS
jgi:hypothetical protein